ncbi:MAG: hypothetical protein WCP86_04855 [bacterium]
MTRRLDQGAWIFAVSLALTWMGCGGAVGETNTVTLARHATVAEFEGCSCHQCLGMTSLCPDKCGQSGTVAAFKVIRYITYEKLGEYGDPKCEQFMFMVEDNMKNPRVPTAIRNAVNSLKKGDRVLLSWNHDYVTVDGSSAPDRPITRLERLLEPAQDNQQPAVGESKPAKAASQAITK